MTKPTKQQVLDCNDIQQLHKWAAIHCMGLHVEPSISGGKYLSEDSCSYFGDVIDWQPCLPTPEGKAQCFDLMVEYKIEIHWNPNWIWFGKGDLITFDKESDFQEAIVKVVIISEIEE